MIVVERDQWLHLASQPDHMRLSGDFARLWGNGPFERPSPHASVVIAAARHDDGWVEPDESPLVNAETGKPIHFLQCDLQEHARLFQRGVDRVTAEDRYAGLLAGLHWTGIYRSRWGLTPRLVFDNVRTALDDVVLEQERVQAALKLALWNPGERRRLFEARLWLNYELLQAWDRLSLFIAHHDLAVPGAREEIGPVPTALGGPDVILTVTAVGDYVVTVDPYPFSEPEIKLSLPGWVLPNRNYASREDLRQTMERSRSAVNFRIVPARA